MRHRKRTFKMGRTGGHRRCMVANQLQSLIEHGKIETSVEKAKHLRRYADRLITVAKRGTIADRRLAAARLMNRKMVGKLFEEIAPRYSERQGGYTSIVRTGCRRGDNSENCIIQFVA